MYIPLRNYTQYTIEESVLSLAPWLSQLVKYQIPAAGCCDKKNLFGLVSFYQQCIKNKIKPLIGSDLIFLVDGYSRPFSLLVYAQNNTGYKILSKIITLCYQEQYQKGLPISMLSAYLGQLLVIVPPESASMLALCPKPLIDLLRPMLFLGVERYLNDAKSLEQSYGLLKIAQDLQIAPIVANSVYFLKPEDYQIQQIKTCIQKSHYLQDEARPVLQFPYHYAYDPQTINELFQDVPVLIENTQRFAQKCTVELNLGITLLPQFAPDEKNILFTKAQEGLQSRIIDTKIPVEKQTIYLERLERELQMIAKMGFAGYFLIVADFIQWAKNQDIPVGPGRGSGAGSLAAYALGITDIDPLPYDLLFERFLNPERVSLPDFDVDFCMSRRDEVIHYVQQRYGGDFVSQIATFGTMAAKAVVRDVGRVLSHPFGFVDKIAKLIPMQVGITLSEALSQNPDFQNLYQSDEVVKELIDIALKLEGMPRNVGKHAGGVVISPVPLHDICPLYNEQGAPWQPITQLDKDDSETLGLIKFDFLGLKTLTVIHSAYRHAKNIHQHIPAPTQLNLADKESYDLMISGKTIGVFQVESRGFRELIMRVKPDCFEDIIALVALYRPGPLQSGMVDDFIDRKHGLAPIVYPHPLVESILKPTYGIILYQEQVMQIAQVLAGYSLGGADLLRRAMGKKKPEEMKKQREIFVTGAANNGVDTKISEGLFDLMEKFSGYGFNKSHAGAYALIVYQTLYLKRHAAAAFFAATLTADADNLEKLAIFVDEVRFLGLTLYPPCVNDSKIEFFARDLQSIQYGLGAIKGLGEQVLAYIVKEREKNGPYVSLQDFLRRLAHTPLSKKHIEILIRVGAFDRFLSNRKALLTQHLPYLWDRFHKGHVAQKGLFDDEDDADLEDPTTTVEEDLWSVRIAVERQLLGFCLSGTIFEPYKDLTSSWKDRFVGPNIPILANLLSSRRIMTQKGAILVATQWLLMNGEKVEYYLNPSKTQDQDLLQKIETLSLDRPVLILCDKLPGSEQRKERVILKNCYTILEWILANKWQFILKPRDLNWQPAVDYIKSLSKWRLPCPLFLKYPLSAQENLKFAFQPAESAQELDIMNFIESIYPLRTECRLQLEAPPKESEVGRDFSRTRDH